MLNQVGNPTKHETDLRLVVPCRVAEQLGQHGDDMLASSGVPVRYGL
jgi:hypothetical protein